MWSASANIRVCAEMNNAERPRAEMLPWTIELRLRVASCIDRAQSKSKAKSKELQPEVTVVIVTVIAEGTVPEP